MGLSRAKLRAVAKRWNEANHPRYPAGHPMGGKFMPKEGGGRRAVLRTRAAKLAAKAVEPLEEEVIREPVRKKKKAKKKPVDYDQLLAQVDQVIADVEFLPPGSKYSPPSAEIKKLMNASGFLVRGKIQNTFDKEGDEAVQAVTSVLSLIEPPQAGLLSELKDVLHASTGINRGDLHRALQKLHSEWVVELVLAVPPQQFIARRWRDM